MVKVMILGVTHKHLLYLVLVDFLLRISSNEDDGLLFYALNRILPGEQLQHYTALARRDSQCSVDIPQRA